MRRPTPGNTNNDQIGDNYEQNPRKFHCISRRCANREFQRETRRVAQTDQQWTHIQSSAVNIPREQRARVAQTFQTVRLTTPFLADDFNGCGLDFVCGHGRFVYDARGDGLEPLCQDECQSDGGFGPRT